MMGMLLRRVALAGVAVLCLLPLLWAAQLGRRCGSIMYFLDGRHRRVALRNLELCFAGTKSPREIHAIARENFRRIGENICCAVKSTSMDDAALGSLLEVRRSASPEAAAGFAARNVVFASGHFGSFELLSRLSPHIREYRHAATYRAIRQEGLDTLLREMRGRSGTALFERRGGAESLKKEMNGGGMLLILLADQSDRSSGLELPFLGHPAFTNRAPAVMAARYDGALFAPVCYRVSLGHYRIETGEPIPTREPSGARRDCEAIMRDINRAFEAAIARDPANWFWVHNRWKTRNGGSVV